MCTEHLLSPSDSLPRDYNGLDPTNVEGSPLPGHVVFSALVSSSGLSSHWPSSHVVLVHVAPGAAAPYSCRRRNWKPKNFSQTFSSNMSGATSQRKEKIIARTGIWLSLNDAARVWFMYLTVLMWHTSVCSQQNVQFDDRLQMGSNQKWNKGRAVLS